MMRETGATFRSEHSLISPNERWRLFTACQVRQAENVLDRAQQHVLKTNKKMRWRIRWWLQCRAVSPENASTDAPLLMLVAFGDHLVPSELATAAYEHAHEPKQLILLPGGHFDAYVAGFAAASGHARDWFVRHLAP